MWPISRRRHEITNVEAGEIVSALFREHSASVFRYLVGIYGRERDAEEVTQEAFLHMHTAIMKNGVMPSPRAWAMGKGRRLMLVRLRRAHIKLGISRRLTTPTGAQRSLSQAVDALTDEERWVLFARAEGLGLREIADALDIAIWGVAHIAARATMKMATNCDLKVYGGNPYGQGAGAGDGGADDEKMGGPRIRGHEPREAARDRP